MPDITNSDILEIALYGHCTHDLLILEDGSQHQALGGSVSYIASVLHSRKSRFQVVTKVGKDFRYSDRMKRFCSHDLFVSADKGTTTFVDEYKNGSRSERVETICEAIAPEDVTRSAKVGILCGIIGEVLPATFEKVIECSDVTMADAQGLLRHVENSGKVAYQPLENTPYLPLVRRLNFLKASAHEAQYIDIAALTQKQLIVIVTEGEAGCTVYTRGDSRHFATSSVQVVDSTGAGDCFLAGFALGVSRGMSLDACIGLAQEYGALAVRSVGLPY